MLGKRKGRKFGAQPDTLHVKIDDRETILSFWGQFLAYFQDLCHVSFGERKPICSFVPWFQNIAHNLTVLICSSK